LFFIIFKMKIFDGKKAAAEIINELSRKISKEKIAPKLAIISVSPDKASKLYMRNKKRAARQAGIKISSFNFSAAASENAIIKKIEHLNRDDSVHGIIVQLPLPKRFNTDKIISKISSQKDVDGFKEDSLLAPVLPSAIFFCLKKAGVGGGKKILALVNSKLFGEVLKSFLKGKGLKMEYALLAEIPIEKMKKADVLILVCGCPGFIKDDMIKDGAVIIDAGITMKGKKVLGDMDKESAKGKASFFTPVPGGVGPLTVALLLKNVYLAYGNSKNN